MAELPHPLVAALESLKTIRGEILPTDDPAVWRSALFSAVDVVLAEYHQIETYRPKHMVHASERHTFDHDQGTWVPEGEK